MGLTKVTVAIKNLAGTGRAFTDEFLVDTGAVDCLAPASRFKKAGIKPNAFRIFKDLNEIKSECSIFLLFRPHPPAPSPIREGE